MTMPPPGIKVVDRLFDHCAEVIEWAEEQPDWAASKVNADNPLDEGRTSDTLAIAMLSFANPDLVHDMNRRVWNELDAYGREHEFSFSSVENASLNRYAIGQQYRDHFDFHPNNVRVLSAVLYLNDVEEGGETTFTRFDYSVQPRAGRLVMFPSNYIYRHAALPPRSGKKYAIAYWARA
ncbi:MAG: 2OG-Fe(II) oxygenase [Actinomycetota bacterium]|nr:2OG-Fe(II) oxygenase [Actinomycetota bacterium]